MKSSCNGGFFSFVRQREIRNVNIYVRKISVGGGGGGVLQCLPR